MRSIKGASATAAKKAAARDGVTSAAPAVKGGANRLLTLADVSPYKRAAERVGRRTTKK